MPFDKQGFGKHGSLLHEGSLNRNVVYQRIFHYKNSTGTIQTRFLGKFTV